VVNIHKMKNKVNINRPEISSEEIAKRKSFDSILNKQVPLNKPFFKKPLFLSGIAIATIATVAAIFLLKNNEEKIRPTTTQVTTTDTTLLADFYKKEEAKPCINPPIDGLNIPATIYKVTAEKGASLDFKTGSKITIPKNAFVDKAGKLLKGEIELRYREFHDAFDFFVAGIPMTYDSAGVRYQFESAGMMELLAYQNGEPVNVAPDKSINISLASNYPATDYNLYKLDTMQNNWSCLGKDKVLTQSTSGTKAITTNIAQVKQTEEYQTIENKITEVEKDKEAKLAELPKTTVIPKKPEQVKKERYSFNLDVDAKEYPELALYKGVLFEVGTENKNFTSDMYNITWEEATIKEGPKKGDNYLLTLKKAPKKYDIVVYPVFEGKNYDVAMKEYQDKFTKYNTTLEKRKVEEKKIEEAYQAQMAMLKKQQESLEHKWAEQQANQFKLMSNQEKVQRMFAVNSFGVFNCDRPSAYPKGAVCTAHLNNAQHSGLICYDVFLVDREKNALFTYAKNPVVNFSFNPQSKNLLFTSENGILYYLKPEQFNEMKDGGVLCDVLMNKVEQKFKTVEEVKAFFNF
jgi:hypothetical protein